MADDNKDISEQPLEEVADEQKQLDDTETKDEIADDRLTADALYQLITQRGQVQGNDPDKPHRFWDTQPVPRLNEDTAENGPIDPLKSIDDVRAEPYNMPAGFTWCTMNVKDETEMAEIYTLLYQNYVEDDDNMFRFDYSTAFLQWALTPPGYIPGFHVGVRNTKNGKLVGFITGVPAQLQVHNNQIPVVEINFLCVHKSLRTKRLAPVLIKEVTRRVNRTGVWQAVYTAGVVLPKPVARCRYWHRSLNPKKLIEVNFSRLQPRMTLARTIKLYKLPDTPNAALRPMTIADVPSAHRLVFHYMSKFKIYPVFSEEDFAHWLLPREGVIDSFVKIDNDTNEVTDFVSFYHLPSTVINHPKHNTLFAAYSYYNVATTMDFKDLMQDALILAKQKNMDVFNALDLMDNSEVLDHLKFGIGDGHLQYYLYNWRCPGIEANELGLVLL